MNDKAKKPQKLRARLPRGLADRGPAELAATRTMLETIRSVYEKYGFDPVETPAFEYTDALGKFLPDQDRPNEGVFSFQDDDEQWISLRYDLTAPLARYVAENYQHLAMPYRSYRAGYVFRNEKPGPGRFRQFMQFDADTVGSASPAADAEMCMMAADAMEALGFARGQYVVKVNSRKVLDGVMESIGLGGDENAGRRLTVLRAIDKLDRLGVVGVNALLGPGRLDESGDFTKGAGLEGKEIEKVLGVVAPSRQFLAEGPDYQVDLDNLLLPGQQPIDEWDSLPDDATSPISFTGIDRVEDRPSATNDQRLLQLWEKIVEDSEIGQEGIGDLARIRRLVRAAGYGTKRIRIDPSVVRGLEYYTGAVFEVELLLATSDEKGRPVRFGSVGGGGRYDGLVSRFRGEPVPATGFSIGVSRLQAALELLNKDKPQPKIFGPAVVTVFGGDIAGYQKMVAELRNANIRAELYLGNPKHSLGQQMKYADRRNSPCAIIQGSDEKAAGTVQIKDLIAGAGLTDIKDREEYLKRQSEAQFSCGESEMVAKVRELLAKHGVEWN